MSKDEALVAGWTAVCGAYARAASRATAGVGVLAEDREALRATLRQQITRTQTSTSVLLRSFSSRFQLTDEEQLAAWLLVSAQLDKAVQRELEVLSGDVEITCSGLAAAAFESPLAALRPLSRSGVLARYGWVELGDGRASWAKTTIRPSERLLSLLTSASWPSELPALVERTPKHGFIGRSEGEAALRKAFESSASLILVAGLPMTGRRTLVRHVLDGLRKKPLEVDVRRLARDSVGLEVQARALAREARLQGGVLVLLDADTLAAERFEELVREISPLIDEHLVLTTGIEPPKIELHDRPLRIVKVESPTHEQLVRAWGLALGQGTAEDAELLADAYPMAPGLIFRAGEAANVQATGRAIEPNDVFEGIRSVVDTSLNRYCRRVNVTQTWNDIVLPADHRQSVRELVARIRERRRVYEQWGFGSKLGKGLGVCALFSGPPGTGKTMIAGLIAQELGLELYQVDLSRVVSKYIGETERNLAALFDAAEAAFAIVLFDEADALFGKRTEVKSSNDRYANFETNFLLQRLESYTGVCLLTSNHESNMDPAFQRRLALHLRFATPDVDERERLWRSLLPEAAPRTATIDFAALARTFELSGGHIRNAALRAAFLAASENTAITHTHLEAAARLECETLGKLAP